MPTRSQSKPVQSLFRGGQRRGLGNVRGSALMERFAQRMVASRKPGTIKNVNHRDKPGVRTVTDLGISRRSSRHRQFRPPAPVTRNSGITRGGTYTR